MKKKMFLEAVSATMNHRKLSWEELSIEQWLGLIEIAGAHHMLEYIYPSIVDTAAARKINSAFFAPFEKAWQSVRDSRTGQSAYGEPKWLIEDRSRVAEILALENWSESRAQEYAAALIMEASEKLINGQMDLRYICDILNYCCSQKSRIRWETLWTICDGKRLTSFSAAILRIGESHLDISLDDLGVTEKWRTVNSDEIPLLENCLSIGMYDELNSLADNGEDRTAIEEKNPWARQLLGSILSALGLGSLEDHTWELDRQRSMERLQNLIAANRKRMIQFYSLG